MLKSGQFRDAAGMGRFNEIASLSFSMKRINAMLGLTEVKTKVGNRAGCFPVLVSTGTTCSLL